MSVTNQESISVTVERHEGGYVVHTQNGTTVMSSLQKAMSLVKATLSPETNKTEE